LEEKLNLKKREVERLNKNLAKEKNLVIDLKKKVRDSRSFSSNSTKDLENIIFSLHDNFNTVIDICVGNINDFKNALCSFG
jgi:Na+/phosphate symporter